MKTIIQIVGELLDFPAKGLIAALEARERERDEAERERVLGIILPQYLSIQRESIRNDLYPPSEPAKLPAGHYAVRNTEYDRRRTYVITLDEPFIPCKYEEYRPITNPFASPPEVTGKAEPPLPTFEEWCAANVFDSSRWYSSPGAALTAIKAALVKKGVVRA